MYAIVDANNFFASCERVFRPDLYQAPIIILSNNDGCVIARSEEAKKLNISMGTPYFQVKGLCERHGIKVFSSNYTLYGDLSHRLMSILRQHWPALEVYSIDEAFLYVDGLSLDAQQALYTRLIRTIKQDIGIPISIGVGPTKTLAKAANVIAKRILKSNFLSLENPESRDVWLSKLPISDVWGIGKRWAESLEKQGILTAKDLQQAHVESMRKQFSVNMAKTIQELQGISCQGLESPTPRKSIVTSRSFGEKQKTYESIAEALAHYSARACQKLRAQHAICSYIQVFLIPTHGESLVSACHRTPTQDTRDVTATAHHLLRQIFKPGYLYQKVGIMLSNLSSEDQVQGDLFSLDQQLFSYSEQPENSASPAAQRLMGVLDTINHRYGSGTLQFAGEGIERPWQMKRNLCSPHYTTQWDELPIARAN